MRPRTPCASASLLPTASVVFESECVGFAADDEFKRVVLDPEVKDAVDGMTSTGQNLKVFTGTTNDDRINREEIFGPVTCVIPWSDYEDVIAQANDTEFGLAASVWTNDLKLAMDAVHRIEAGICQVNQNIVVQSAISYGGVKASGLGKEASLESMLEHFTHKKTIIVNMT